MSQAFRVGMMVRTRLGEIWKVVAITPHSHDDFTAVDQYGFMWRGRISNVLPIDAWNEP